MTAALVTGWQRVVLEALRDLAATTGGPVTRQALLRRRLPWMVERVGRAPSQPAQAVSLALQRLRDKGLVAFVGVGRYRLGADATTNAGDVASQPDGREGLRVHSPQIEEWLTREGIPFHHEAVVPAGRFDLQRSRDNQARLSGWRLPEMIERYGLAMLDGASFPALIAYPGPDGLVLNDGNQRLAAALEVERAAFDVYLLDTTDKRQLDLVTLRANSILNGAGEEPGESLVKAKSYLLLYPSYTVKEVARMFGLKERKLLESRRQDEVTVRLGKLGVQVEGINAVVLRRLHAVEADPVLRELGALAGAADLRGHEMDALLAALRPYRTEAEQLRVIREWRERPDIKEKLRRRLRGLPKARAPRSTSLLTRLRDVTAMVRRYPSLVALEFTRPEQVEALRGSVTDLVEAVNALFRAPGVGSPPQEQSA